MPEFDLSRMRGVFIDGLASGKSDAASIESAKTRLHQILHRFYERMGADTMLGFFFAGKDLALIAENQARFLLRAMGVEPSYSGKAPATAHLALPPILSGHFDRRLRLLEETLKAEGLPSAFIQTWVQFEGLFRESIVSD